MGIDPDELKKEPPPEEQDPRDNPLYLKAYYSAVDVMDWLRTNIPAEADEEKEIIPAINKTRRNEVLEVIYWYNFFIPSKISRALSGRLNVEPGKNHVDSNGSAKTALVALDRSISAWSVLMEEMPANQDKILEILINLAEIRKQTEMTFPLGRKFIRPGFDE
jgi:hypothetical protein